MPAVPPGGFGQQVAPVDVRVRDRHDPFAGRHGDFFVTGADELPGEALVAVPRLAQPHTGAPAEEAPEVVRLRERPLRSRRRDLERVVDKQLTQVVRHALAERQRHTVRMIDEQPQPLRSHLLAREQLDVRLEAGQALLDVVGEGIGLHEI